MNYYELLDIAKDADSETIKRAYFAAVKKHSPDSDPEGFKDVRTAYETLRDPKKREGYDAYFVVSGDAGENIQNGIFAARELMRQNKYKQAVESLTENSKINPGSTELKRLLAEALWNINKMVTADNICKELLEKDPSDWETLLLRARISGSRGHWNKAGEYFDAAAECNPNSPRLWTEYIRYAMDNVEWRVPGICERAIKIDPDMFCGDYEYYLYPALDKGSLMIASFSETKPLSENLKFCFDKFTEYFTADKNPSETAYKTALAALACICKKNGFAAVAEKMLPALESCARRSESDDEIFRHMYAAAALAKLKGDKRIHEVLIDYTVRTIEDCGCSECKDEKMDAECYIAMNLLDLRASIRALRNNYPEYFKLNQMFYQDALNEKKTEYLEDKYFKVFKRLAKSAQEEEYYDEEEDDDYDIFGGGYDSYETQKPFVREAPKVGRNEPCPCGSGKKYKKCCGLNN